MPGRLSLLRRVFPAFSPLAVIVLQFALAPSTAAASAAPSNISVGSEEGVAGKWSNISAPVEEGPWSSASPAGADPPFAEHIRKWSNISAPEEEGTWSSTSLAGADHLTDAGSPDSEAVRSPDDDAELEQSWRRLDHGPPLPDVPDLSHIQLWAGGSGRGSGTSELNAPSKAVLAADGTLYVVDTANHRVQAWRTNQYVGPLGHTPETVAGGNGPGRELDQLRYPMGLALDEAGDLYVADSGNNRVVKWALGASQGSVVAGQPGLLRDKQGAIVGSEPLCCQAGRGAMQLSDPRGVVVDSSSPGVLYIADTGNNRVQRVDPAAGAAETLAADLHRPEGLAVFNGQVVYVADTRADAVLAFPPGDTVGTVVAGGQRGSGLQHLVGPTDVAVIENGVDRELFVCDTYNHRIMRYRLGSGLFSTSPGSLDSDPELVAGGCLDSPDYIQPCVGGGLHDPPDPGQDRVDHLNPSNANPPYYHFWGPRGVLVQSGVGGRNITVVDTSNHRVLTRME